MSDAVLLIASYQSHIFIVLAGVGLLYLRSLLQARRYLERTPFGLEREIALRKQNRSLAMLTVVVVLAVAVYVMDQLAVPQRLTAARPTPTSPPPTPTPTPVVVSSGIVVDSSGCENPNATLTAPQPDERISGAFEVRGTANIDNFAFYKIEISGAGTGGQWLSLDVGTRPVVDGELGSFDSGAREPGEYAFRLVVLDNTGNFPPPCVVPITIADSGL